MLTDRLIYSLDLDTIYFCYGLVRKYRFLLLFYGGSIKTTSLQWKCQVWQIVADVVIAESKASQQIERRFFAVDDRGMGRKRHYESHNNEF